MDPVHRAWMPLMLLVAFYLGCGGGHQGPRTPIAAIDAPEADSWSDGTYQIVPSPDALIEKLTALEPPRAEPLRPRPFTSHRQGNGGPLGPRHSGVLPFPKGPATPILPPQSICGPAPSIQDVGFRG